MNFKNHKDNNMKIIVAGDYCPRNRVAKMISEGDYQSVLGEVNCITKSADYSIVNLECPVVYQEAVPICKCGPNLKCSSKAIEALKWAGFDCVSLANNHFLDYGIIGVDNTLHACQSLELDYVGGGKSAEDAGMILYKDINGQKLAIINCCEHEFSIATDTTAGSNPLNIVKQYYTIKEARKNADYIIVIIHGGVELFWLPTKRMIETYRFFVDSGADVIINHHQHCYSGYEVYKDRPIFYGLGNFCFDEKPNDYNWTSGYMVELIFEYERNIKFNIVPYRQCTKESKVRILKGNEKDEFITNLNSYNNILSDDALREKEYLKWCQQTEGMYKLMLNPANNRYTSWFFKSSIGKRIINKRKVLQMYDYLVNESHIERVRLLFDKVLKES